MQSAMAALNEKLGLCPKTFGEATVDGKLVKLYTLKNEMSIGKKIFIALGGEPPLLNDIKKYKLF